MSSYKLDSGEWNSLERLCDLERHKVIKADYQLEILKKVWAYILQVQMLFNILSCIGILSNAYKKMGC